MVTISRGGAFSADAFRWALTFQFGKIFYDNSPDSCWFRDIGDWGTLSKIDQDFANLTSYKIFSKFFFENFGVNKNSVACLDFYLRYYHMIWDNFTELMKNFQLHQFKFKNSTDNDFIKVMNALKDSGEDLKNLFKKYHITFK